MFDASSIPIAIDAITAINAARIQDLSQWLEKENQTSPAFETLFSQLKVIIQVQIRRCQYAAANRILSRMARIADEKDKSRPALGNLCRNVISGVAGKDIINLLIAEIQGKQDDMEQSVIVETLSLLNPVSAELMLDRLKETKERSLRSLILLQKLQDVDASALTEIVRFREIIEAQRSRSIDRNHLESFKDFYDQLTILERNALFRTMQKVACKEDQSLLQQGKPNDHLYFIHAGDLKVFYRQNGREMLLSQIGTGGLVGAESFFHATVATVSAMTLDQTFIDANDVLSWEFDL